MDFLSKLSQNQNKLIKCCWFSVVFYTHLEIKKKYKCTAKLVIVVCTLSAAVAVTQLMEAIKVLVTLF